MEIIVNKDCSRMKRLIIIGASGHGKVVADIARLRGYEDILFLDDNQDLTNCGKYPVVGKSSEINKFDGNVIVAIGNAKIRQKLQQSIDSTRLVTLIHPDAVVAEDVSISYGSVIMAGVIINSGTVIRKGCIINTASSVDHDCSIGEFCHIAIGAHLAGSVKIGNKTWIGAGAIVSNNIKICDNCMIGAGAVVIKDINEGGVYIGVPARLTTVFEKL